MAVRAIPTTYRGVRFASTLEADWAKNLDALRIRWEYEPEGVKLPDGQNYRCDLYLPHIRAWLEVKGPHDQRIDKPHTLARAVMHAPGCELDDPVLRAARPAGISPGTCPCGFGPSFPYQLVLIGRPAVAGKLTFEPGLVQPAGSLLSVLSCQRCQQHSFVDLLANVAMCRRCHSDATGSPAYPSGALPFHRVEPPRRSGSRRKRSAA